MVERISNASRVDLTPLHTDDDGKKSIRWILKKGGREIVYEKEPYVGFWKKMTVKIIGLLPVESFL